MAFLLIYPKSENSRNCVLFEYNFEIPFLYWYILVKFCIRSFRLSFIVHKYSHFYDWMSFCTSVAKWLRFVRRLLTWPDGAGLNIIRIKGLNRKKKRGTAYSLKLKTLSSVIQEYFPNYFKILGKLHPIFGWLVCSIIYFSISDYGPLSRNIQILSRSGNWRLEVQLTISSVLIGPG